MAMAAVPDKEDGLSRYSRIEKIGEGTYGAVYKAVDKETGKMVAVKQIKFFETKDGTLTSAVVREVALMRELNHPNIVRLEDVILDTADVHLVFEYLYTDLHQYLKDLPPNVLMERWLQKSFQYQILQGMCYCHQRAILHRDMKPQNLLLSIDGAIKIADFGLCREFHVPTRAYTFNVVTPIYRAPELLLGTLRYTPAVDMWSIGCIFAEMAMKQVLFSAHSTQGQLKQIFTILTTPTEENWKGVTEMPYYNIVMFPRYEEDLLDELLGPYVDPIGIAVIRLLLAYDPAQRISAKRLLRHHYYDDVDRSKLPAPNYDGTLEIPPLSQIRRRFS